MLLTAVVKGRSVFITEIAMTKCFNGSQRLKCFIAVLCEGATALTILISYAPIRILNMLQSGAWHRRAPLSTARQGLQGSH